METVIPRLLRDARHIAVLTGAGVSAESGIATFRDAQTGLWAKYRPEDLATPEAYQRNPRLVWEWYQWRRQVLSGVSPNPGHFALTEMEKRITGRGGQFTLITQNVDGLHRRAGSRNIVELHGNIGRVKCFAIGTIVETWEIAEDVPPRCPNCGGMLRPDVVWFGETLPPAALAQAIDAAETCDFFISAGTSTLVQPAASLPWLALQHNAFVLEINPNETPLTSFASAALHALSGEALPELVAAAFG